MQSAKNVVIYKLTNTICSMDSVSSASELSEYFPTLEIFTLESVQSSRQQQSFKDGILL